ncbi:hypothetical protein SUDANB176_06158 [Streptomyces sp. enrichment culture]
MISTRTAGPARRSTGPSRGTRPSAPSARLSRRRSGDATRTSVRGPRGPRISGPCRPPSAGWSPARAGSSTSRWIRAPVSASARCSSRATCRPCATWPAAPPCCASAASSKGAGPRRSPAAPGAVHRGAAPGRAQPAGAHRAARPGALGGRPALRLSVAVPRRRQADDARTTAFPAASDGPDGHRRHCVRPQPGSRPAHATGWGAAACPSVPGLRTACCSRSRAHSGVRSGREGNPEAAYCTEGARHGGRRLLHA